MPEASEPDRPRWSPTDWTNFFDCTGPSIAPSIEAIKKAIDEAADVAGPPSPRLVIHRSILREVIDAL